EVAPAAEMLARVIAHLSEFADEFARDRARNLQALALAVARHLVQREMVHDPSIVRDLVARALELMPLDAEIAIRVNPQDLVALGDTLAQAEPPGRPVTLRWVP